MTKGNKMNEVKRFGWIPNKSVYLPMGVSPVFGECEDGQYAEYVLLQAAQARIAELEAQNKNLQFENNGMRELLQHFVLGYRQGRDLSAVYMDARTVLEKSA